jgi:hypothetical protein
MCNWSFLLQEHDFYLNLENDVEDNEFSNYDQIGKRESTKER